MEMEYLVHLPLTLLPLAINGEENFPMIHLEYFICEINTTG